MEYRILGKTGLRVSRLGFGGIPIQRIDAEGTKALIRKLVEAGVNYIDTARGYTVSEEYLGYALEGIRDKFVLATKGRGLTKEATGIGWFYILCGFDNREGGRLGTGSNEYIRETVYWSCRYGCCS